MEMENLKGDSVVETTGGLLQCPTKDSVLTDTTTTTTLRGFNFNGINMLDLTHHLENDTVMSTSSSTSGGLVIDHDDGDAGNEEQPRSHKGIVVPQNNGGETIFSTPLPRRRSSAWSGSDKQLLMRDCSQYLGMQPSVKFKCYKCAESNFPTLLHLKEHQQVCLTEPLGNGPNGRRTNGEYNSTKDANTKIRISRKVFLCSSCGTYYENWNLFLHMREVHRKHICLLCLGMFPSAERLHHHLESKHGIASADIATNDIKQQINSQLFYLMCVTCEHIFTEHDAFVHHNCDTYLQPCALCGCRGAHKTNCRASVNQDAKTKRNGQTTNEVVTAEVKQSSIKVPDVVAAAAPPPPEEPPQPPPVPEVLDPVGEMWRRYLNGDFDTESRTPPPTTPEVKAEEPRVPKLKVKIPKEYQTKLNSPVSTSSEGESEEEAAEEVIRSQDTLPENATQDVAADAAAQEVEEEEEEEEEQVKKEDMDEEEEVKDEKPPVVENAPEATDIPDDATVPRAADADEVKPKVEMDDDDEEDEDGIPIAKKDAQMFDLRLNQPLDRIDMVELLRICLMQTIPFCLYCNHTTRIVVNAKHLAMHLIGTHRFTATVDSITAEELQPETIVARVKRVLDDLEGIYINLDTFDSRADTLALKTPCDRSFNCFQCRLVARVHKELYQHNRKMHMKTVILCLMCKSALYSYSELLYHMCPGYMSTTATLELKFRCGFCSLHSIPSAFRLMVHLRKKHGICEICLEDCGDQFKLSNHVWKHKLQHLCFRCGIVYRNKPDITKHLFWKHGTESVTCKKCLQKKWPLVYHFCIPPAQFTCEHCPQIFTRAVSLTVHRRFHAGDFKYPCTEEKCEKKFISRRLLEKHTLKHSQFIADEPVFFEEKKKSPNATECKDPVPMDVEEKVDVVVEKQERKAAKRAKGKKDDGKRVDLMEIDLPAPNLSESDSDMDIDRDDSCDTTTNAPAVAAQQEAAAAPMVVEEEDEKVPPPAVVDIWANFKTYQTLQQQASKVEDEDDEVLATIPILHVSQSDHDYCSIYRVPGKVVNDVKAEVAATTKDSSDSSSGSDSTCTCGSNCSCSSSSSSGSSSSSSSSSDEGKLSPRKKSHTKKREKGAMKVVKEEPKAQTDVIDVVTVDKMHEGDENFEVHFESDLATDESDTDEDFYDEHPQKVAREMMMAWNRKFDEDTHDGAVAEDEEEQQPPPPVKREKKVKRKKKEKRHQKLPPLKLSLIAPTVQVAAAQPLPPTPQPAPILTAALTAPFVSPRTPILSNGSGGDDGVKRSKRRRIPNKFYGYSSDEDGGHVMTTPTILKPIQPPNLVWNKEDLPQSSSTTTTRSPTFQSLLMAKKASPTSDFATYNIQPPAQLPPQIFASTSPGKEPLVQPLRLPLPPVVPVNRSYSDMAEATGGDTGGVVSASGDDDEEDEDTASSDASHLEIAPVTAPTLRISLTNQTATLTDAPMPQQQQQKKQSDNVYCYCRCPYDEVSEMIACDGDNCAIEWFHFECVGIMVPPVGKWYCPECKLKHQPETSANFY